MRLVDGHKGKAGYRCTVTGREAHSAYRSSVPTPWSRPPGSSPAWRRWARRFAARRAVRGRVRPAAPHLGRRPDRGRLAAQHHPQPLQLRVRVPHPAGRGPAALRARDRGVRAGRVLPGLRATAPEADDRVRGGAGLSRHDPAVRERVRPPLPRADRHARPGQGLVRHRGRLLRARAASRPWSAAPATSRSPTSPTSGSRSSSSSGATRFCASSCVAALTSN